MHLLGPHRASYRHMREIEEGRLYVKALGRLGCSLVALILPPKADMDITGLVIGASIVFYLAR